ncbi:Kinesin protein [Phytophthora cinnamomi]|uniref:Kinesin protein n=1 Tax=Phytophthora cinnamomi TaxID=4785 RepID=UPI0035596CAC|nr:Kinesin protein [Phytophthora cinnamomi]
MVMFAFRGIVYFVCHPALWKEVALPLLLTVIFGVTAAYYLFNHTLSRQQDWLNDKDIPKQFAESLALSIVVMEIFVSTALYGVVCIDYFQDKIFAFVLQDRGLGDMLEGRERRSTAVRVCTSYFLSRSALGVISLPLHLVPVLGTLVYAWLHGGVLAWENHSFYFELKGFGLRQQQRWMRRYKVQYSHFGVEALLLHMVPCAGPFFIFTNACGAALLAEELERASRGGKRSEVDEEEATLLDSEGSGEFAMYMCDEA